MSSPLYFSANGIRVTAASVLIPWYGAPVADVTFPVSVTLTAPVTLTAANLTLTLGILRQRSFAGGATARLVGGIGWGRALVDTNGRPIPAYANPAGVKLSTILRDVARRVGETVSIGADRTVGLFYVPSTGPAARVLEQLGGPSWYVDGAGVTQVRDRVPSTITSAATVQDYMGGMGWLTVATEDLAAWMPAAIFSSNTVTTPIQVSATRIHTDNDGTLRLEILTT